MAQIALQVGWVKAVGVTIAKRLRDRPTKTRRKDEHVETDRPTDRQREEHSGDDRLLDRLIDRQSPLSTCLGARRKVGLKTMTKTMHWFGDEPF